MRLRHASAAITATATCIGFNSELDISCMVHELQHSRQAPGAYHASAASTATASTFTKNIQLRAFCYELQHSFGLTHIHSTYLHHASAARIAAVTLLQAQQAHTRRVPAGGTYLHHASAARTATAGSSASMSCSSSMCRSAVVMKGRLSWLCAAQRTMGTSVLASCSDGAAQATWEGRGSNQRTQETAEGTTRKEATHMLLPRQASLCIRHSMDVQQAHLHLQQGEHVLKLCRCCCCCCCMSCRGSDWGELSRCECVACVRALQCSSHCCLCCCSCCCCGCHGRACRAVRHPRQCHSCCSSRV
jgi:hypothetical protein